MAGHGGWREFPTREFDHKCGGPRQVVVLPARRASGIPIQAHNLRGAETAVTVGKARVSARQVNDVQGLVIPDRDPWPQRVDEVADHPCLGFRGRSLSRVVESAATLERSPQVGEVAIEVNAPCVLTRPKCAAVGVCVTYDPQAGTANRGPSGKATRDRRTGTFVAMHRTDDENLDARMRVSEFRRHDWTAKDRTTEDMSGPGRAVPSSATINLTRSKGEPNGDQQGCRERRAFHRGRR